MGKRSQKPVCLQFYYVRKVHKSLGEQCDENHLHFLHISEEYLACIIVLRLYNKKQIACDVLPDIWIWQKTWSNKASGIISLFHYWLLSSSVETAVFPRADQIYFLACNRLTCMWWANIFHQDIFHRFQMRSVGLEIIGSGLTWRMAFWDLKKKKKS